MTTDPVLTAVTHWEVIIGLIVSSAFPLVVLRWWPWNQSAWGWNTVLLELSIAVCLLPSFMYIVFHLDDSVLRWTAAIGLALVIANVIWRIFLIRNTQIAETTADAIRRRARERAAATADESVGD